ncbi:MAG: hypothetical protein QG552_3262 [Thermodesulfobacteriota bacterium]|nr:hypothetical protein [Thermodesulfobacteriota bacterium]
MKQENWGLRPTLLWGVKKIKVTSQKNEIDDAEKTIAPVSWK